MAYEKTVWVDEDEPAIDAANLNKIEDQIYALTEDALTPTWETAVTVTAPITSLASTILEAPFSTAYLRGRTVANILGNVGDCESTSGWVSYASRTTIETSGTYKVFGSNSLKLTSASGGYNIVSRQVTGIVNNRYYLLALYIRKNSAEGDVYNFGVSNTSPTTDGSFYASIQIASDSTVDAYFRREGLVFQATADDPYIGTVRGGTTAYGYINLDGIQLIEISSAEYALGATALLSKYPYHNDIKGSDKQIVKSVGKNLFTEDYASGWSDAKYDAVGLTTGRLYMSISMNTKTIIGHDSVLYGAQFYQKISVVYGQNYKFSSDGNLRWTVRELGVNGENLRGDVAYGYYTVGDGTSITYTPQLSSTKYITIWLSSTLTSTSVSFTWVQIENGSTATSYEPYKLTSAIVPYELNGISDTVYDIGNLITGVKTKNVSDVVTLSGNAYTWAIYSDISAAKMINVVETFPLAADNGESLYKYNNKKIIHDGSFTVADTSQLYTDKKIYIAVSDTDTGFPDAWVSGTSFTTLTWNGLIKAYMNGWKLTTANVDVASCVWTGITSGTVKNAGADDYTHVTTNIDVGFQPYRMYYQLATPLTQSYVGEVLNSNASGTIVVEPVTTDYIGLYSLPSLTYQTVSNTKAAIVELTREGARIDDKIITSINANKRTSYQTAMSGWRF